VWKVRQPDSVLIKEETIFTLRPERAPGAGQQLYAIKSLTARVFQWLRMEPELSHFKAGTYRFTPHMTVREMLQLLASGKEAQFPLRFVCKRGERLPASAARCALRQAYAGG
jgi:UPF0755 protein